MNSVPFLSKKFQTQSMHYGPSTYRTYTGSRVLRVQFLEPNLGQFAQILQFILLTCNMEIAQVMPQIVVKGLNIWLNIF